MALNYYACETLWNSRRKSNDYKPLREIHTGAELRHDARRGCFLVRLHTTTVVEVFRDHYALFMGGWDTQSTRRVIWEVARVAIHTDRTPGLLQPVVVGGHPFFDGIRVGYDRQVFHEDRRPVQRKREKKDAQKAYAKKVRRLADALRGRFELGEFKDAVSPDYHAANAEFRTLLDAPDDYFISHDEAARMLCWNVTLSFDDLIAQMRKDVRAKWFTAHDGYCIEVTQ